MADEFMEDERTDLLERGFTEEQIEHLESLELGKPGLYSDICKLMDDDDDFTPADVIQYFDEPEPHQIATTNTPPLQGGKRRRTKRNVKGRKSRKSRKSKRTKRNVKGRKGKKSRR